MNKTTANPHLRELFLNQLWQSANFACKAAFLVLLTPLMLARWGAVHYGLFALAASLLVTMGLLDGGVRALTRIRLAEALKAGDDLAFRRAFGGGMVTFAIVVSIAIATVALAASSGWLEQIFNLPPGGSRLLTVAVLLTAAFMLTNLSLEPVAARGELSAIKAANTWGAIVSIPACAFIVWQGGSVMLTLIVYMSCAIIPNLVLGYRCGVGRLFRGPERAALHPRVFAGTLRAGIWYYLTTVSLVLKGHALTFVVSALAGPAEAGLFYIVLRLTEVVSNLGTTASETSLASLAAAPTAEERRQRFQHSWIYVSIFCLYGAIFLSTFGEPLLRRWLSGSQHIAGGLGAAMALSGLTSALSRVAVNASMGLGNVRDAAVANLIEAGIDLGLAIPGYYLAGLPGLLVGASLGVGAMVPIFRQIAHLCEETISSAFGKPLVVLLPGLCLCLVVQICASRTQYLPFWAAAIVVSGFAVLVQLRSIHKPAGVPVAP